MKKIMTCIILVMLLLSLLGCSRNDVNSGNTPNQESSEKTLNITLADYGSSKMPPADAYRYAVEYLKEKSGGKINVDYVPDGALGYEAESIQQLMDGTIEAAVLGTSTFSKYTNKLEVFQLPFLLNDYEKELAAFESPEGRALLDSVEELGFKIITFTENGMRNFANNARPILKTEDLKGLKLRIAPSNMLQNAMNLLGANPTPLNYAEIYTALQNKVIDGEEVNITSLYAMKHYETIKYFSEIGMYPFPAVVVFNLDYWNSLSEEDQNLIMEAFKEATKKELTEYLPNFEKMAREECEKAGVEFNVIEDKQAFKDLVAPLYEEYKDKDPDIAAFIKMVEELKN
ncbi:MAG: TRAP transporter substrate-binding protein [Sedimentibacter sp.]|uniref:TRAP transporter substrate-binding protein n=1 Tax=Sedimentibacter sp. TaxID=1960295 RepID=UPI0031587897